MTICIQSLDLCGSALLWITHSYNSEKSTPQKITISKVLRLLKSCLSSARIERVFDEGIVGISMRLAS